MADPKVDIVRALSQTDIDPSQISSIVQRIQNLSDLELIIPKSYVDQGKLNELKIWALSQGTLLYSIRILY